MKLFIPLRLLFVVGLYLIKRQPQQYKTFLSSASGFIELLSHFVAAIFAILGAIPCKREVFCLVSSKDFHSANEIEFTFSCCFSELKLRTGCLLQTCSIFKENSNVLLQKVVGRFCQYFDTKKVFHA